MSLLRCTDCRFPAWTIGEDFYVLDGLWHLIMPRSKWEDIICLGCYEKRLGRKLQRKDFKRWFRNNRCFGNRNRFLNDPISSRLAKRLQLKA